MGAIKNDVIGINNTLDFVIALYVLLYIHVIRFLRTRSGVSVHHDGNKFSTVFASFLKHFHHQICCLSGDDTEIQILSTDLLTFA